MNFADSALLALQDIASIPNRVCSICLKSPCHHKRKYDPAYVVKWCIEIANAALATIPEGMRLAYSCKATIELESELDAAHDRIEVLTRQRNALLNAIEIAGFRLVTNNGLTLEIAPDDGGKDGRNFVILNTLPVQSPETKPGPRKRRKKEEKQ